VVLGGGKIVDRFGDAAWDECQGEPVVDLAEDRVLAQADAQRVLDVVGQRVGMPGAVRLVPGGLACASADDDLDLVEGGPVEPPAGFLAPPRSAAGPQRVP
jgi:hypothetical protein